MIKPISFFSFFLLSLYLCIGHIGIEASCAAEEYLVNPGDTLFISVLGQAGLSGNVVVGPDGSISLSPPVGVLSVSGLTLSEIQQLLIKRLGEYFRNPQVTVSLKALEDFTIHVLGEVKSPGFYKVPQNTTLQEVLTLAGGATEWSDLRRVRLLRKDNSGNLGDSGQVSERIVNLNRFIEDGDLAFNPALQMEDKVIMPRLPLSERKKGKGSVTVLGAVNMPGAYEVEEPTPILKILALAKGATASADLKSILVYFSNSEPRTESIDLEAYLNYLKGLKGLKGKREGRLENSENSENGENSENHLEHLIAPGAVVFVPSQLPAENNIDIHVNVMGQVQRPGGFSVPKSSRLIDAIAMAGGFEDGAQLEAVRIFRAAAQSPISVEVNFKNYLKHGDVDSNPPLNDGDTVVVPIASTSKRVLTIQSVFSPYILVRVIGEVKEPGSFQLSQNANLLDALMLAGGPLADADLERSMLIREGNGKDGKGGKQFHIRVNMVEVLQEGRFELLPAIRNQDTLFIPKQKKKESNLWGKVVRTAADVFIIANLAYLVTITATARR